MQRPAVLAWSLFTVGAALAACSSAAQTAPASSPPAPSVTVSTPSAALPPPQPTTPPAHSAAPKTVNFVDLRLGDCVIDLPPSDLSTVTVSVVDCTTPHLAEVITRHDIEVNTAVNDVANQACTAGLHTYAGGASSQRLSVTYLIDSNQDRTSDNPLPSTVICLAQSADGSALQGSIRR